MLEHHHDISSVAFRHSQIFKNKISKKEKLYIDSVEKQGKKQTHPYTSGEETGEISSRDE